MFNIIHFSSTCCTKNFSLMSCFTIAKRIQNQKEEERVVSKSRRAVTNMSSFIATSSSTASSPIASESPGMPIASGKPDNRMSVEPSSFDGASTDSRMHTLMEEQWGDPSHQEEEDSEDSDNPAAGTWYCKGELLAQNNKACVKPLAHGASSSVDQEESKEHGSDMGPLLPNIAGHIELHGSSLLHGQADLWKTTRQSYGRFECEFGYLVNAHEYHSSRNSSSRKRL